MTSLSCLEKRKPGKCAKELADSLEKVAPGLLEGALQQYEEVSGNYLEEPDTFIHQVAIVVVNVIQTQRPHMALVTTIDNEEYRFTAQILDGILQYGMVGANVSDWLKRRPHDGRMIDETS